MKKIVSIVLCIFIIGSIVGCGSSQDSKPKPVVNTTGKTLVVYFSMPETENAENMNTEEEYSTVVIDGKVMGNTQYVADVIQKNTKADIFRIEPETPYPMNHEELEEVATKEKSEEAYPTMKTKIENISQYDTIFVGYPCWYANMPRILYSFFKNYDLSHKTVIPFVTSGANGFADTIETITELEPNAEVVTDGFSVTRDKVQDAEGDIVSWLKEFGF